MALLDWLRPKPKSLLRELAGSTDPTKLLDAAILIKRAGLEHLVGVAGEAEVLVMARAGEILQKENNVQLAYGLRNYGEFVAEFDGGEARDNEVLDEMQGRSHGR